MLGSKRQGEKIIIIITMIHRQPSIGIHTHQQWVQTERWLESDGRTASYIINVEKIGVMQVLLPLPLCMTNDDGDDDAHVQYNKLFSRRTYHAQQ